MAASSRTNFAALTGLSTVFEGAFSAMPDNAAIRSRFCHIVENWANQKDAGSEIEALVTQHQAAADFFATVGSPQALDDRKRTALSTFAKYKLGEMQAEEQDFAMQHSLAVACGCSLEEARESSPFSSNYTPPELRLHNINLQEFYEGLKQEHVRLPDREVVEEIACRAYDIFAKEPPIVCMDAPLVIVGDVHGNTQDLLTQILTAGEIGKDRFLFLGDYVDRGESSIHCLLLLLVAKLLHPDRVMILRGNHEARTTNAIYGFLNECHTLYPTSDPMNNTVWGAFNRTFDAMPLAALVSERVLCVHGGLSPKFDRIEALLCVNRYRDSSIIDDLTWSDPGVGEGYRPSPRGTGQIFGEDATLDLCAKNNLKFICRAHQCVRAGYQWDHSGKLLTVFSSSNYCYMGNKGAVLLLDGELSCSFKTYERHVGAGDDDDDERAVGSPQPKGNMVFPSYFA